MAEEDEEPAADDALVDDGEEILEGCEVLALRIEFELVPEWSNMVERMANYHGERVAVGVQDGVLVVKVAVTPEKKTLLLADMQQTWELFVERRKRDGRWDT